MIYSLKINGITECTNGYIAFKIRCLLFDTFSKISQSFWPKAFIIDIYLSNYFFLFFLKYDYLLAKWLRIYNFSNKNYTYNLGYLKTFGCRIYTKISDKKWVKNSNIAPDNGREGYFMGYTSESSIYQIYLPNS